MTLSIQQRDFTHKDDGNIDLSPRIRRETNRFNNQRIRLSPTKKVALRFAARKECFNKVKKKLFADFSFLIKTVFPNFFLNSKFARLISSVDNKC